MRNILMVTLAFFALSGCIENGGEAPTDQSSTSPSTPVDAIFGCTDPLASNYDIAATQNDGSCMGRNGESAYYGLSSSSLNHVYNSQFTPINLNSNIVVPGEFYVQIGGGSESSNSAKANSRDIVAAVHSPVCRTRDEDPKHYAAIKIVGSEWASAADIVVTDRNVNIVPLDFYFSTNRRSSDPNYEYNVSECYRGRVKINGSFGYLYENGKVMVMKTIDGDFYIGFADNLTSTDFSFNFQAYSQSYFAGCTLADCSSSTSSPQSEITAAGSTSYNFNNGLITTAFGTGTLYPYQSGVLSDGYPPSWWPATSDFSTHSVIEGSGEPMIAIMAQLGGRYVIIGSVPGLGFATWPTWESKGLLMGISSP